MFKLFDFVKSMGFRVNSKITYQEQPKPKFTQGIWEKTICTPDKDAVTLHTHTHDPVAVQDILLKKFQYHCVLLFHSWSEKKPLRKDGAPIVTIAHSEMSTFD